MGGSPCWRRSRCRLGDQSLSAVRDGIAREVEIIGEGGLAEEREELEQLDRIRAALNRAAAGERDTGWRRSLGSAVQEEEREIALLDAAERRLLEQLQLLQALVLLAAIGAGTARAPDRFNAAWRTFGRELLQCSPAHPH